MGQYVSERITGQIIRLSRNCPKPDNWFSGIAKTKEKGEIMVVCKPNFQVEMGMPFKADIISEKQTQKGNTQFILDNNSFERVFPANEKTIVSFLSGPDFKGVGIAAAKKLFATFGADVFEVIRKQPDRLTNEAGITDAQKSVLVNGIMGAEGCLITRYPQLRRSQAVNLLKTLGDDMTAVIQQINRNVYALVHMVRGFDFETADRIFLESLMRPRTDPKRLSAILNLTMEDYVSDTGHNYANVEDGDCYALLLQRFNVKAGIQYNGQQFSQLIKQTDEELKAIMDCTLIEEAGEMHLYLNADLQAQQYIVDAVHEASTNFPVQKLTKTMALTLANLADPTKTISSEQKMATGTSLAAGLSIISGGPGRGKSMLMDVICRTWQNAFMGTRQKDQTDNIVLIAPTGRAAKNMTEKTGLHAITAARLTVCREAIHKVISGMQYRGLKPCYGIEDTQMYEGGLAIIDECSMIGTRTMGHLLQILVLWFHMQVILVGDPDQLPAIENGSPFLDLINSGKIPVSTLTVNFRANGKDIIDNAEKICAGDTNITPGPSFHTAWYANNDDTSRLIMNLYYQKMGINPNSPMMPSPKMFSRNLLLCPLNKGTAGVHYLNSCIQDMVNPETPGKFYDVDPTIINSPKCTMDAGYAIPGTFQNTNRERTLPDGKVVKWTRLRVGDRVVNTENDPERRLYRRKNNNIDGEEVSYVDGISNGDRGVIVRYTKAYRNFYPSITVRLDNGMFTEFYIDPDDPSALKLQLGYALTVHKAQGSEARTVIVSLPGELDYIPDDMNFATRNLLYTAVTRAMDETYVIGSQTAMNKCILNPARTRNSTLASYL